MNHFVISSEENKIITGIQIFRYYIILTQSSLAFQNISNGFGQSQLSLQTKATALQKHLGLASSTVVTSKRNSDPYYTHKYAYTSYYIWISWHQPVTIFFGNCRRGAEFYGQVLPSSLSLSPINIFGAFLSTDLITFNINTFRDSAVFLAWRQISFRVQIKLTTNQNTSTNIFVTS